MFKVLAILVVVAVKIYPVELEDLRPAWKSEKKTALHKVINNKPIIHNVRDFNTRKKTQKRELVLS